MYFLAGFFFDLTQCMTKLRVLVLCLSYLYCDMNKSYRQLDLCKVHVEMVVTLEAIYKKFISPLNISTWW
jgi:hypothetical protein